MKILVLNGPNLNLLKIRDSQNYGDLSLTDIENQIKEFFPKVYVEFFQSNVEGELINQIQKADNYFDGLIINPGGYSHTSVAIRDALELVKIPKIEVHLSNLSGREEYRQNLITASACDGYISGFKSYGYLSAIWLIMNIAN